MELSTRLGLVVVPLPWTWDLAFSTWDLGFLNPKP